MDLDKTLHELYEEKKRIDRTISRLETRLATLSGKPQVRRGRKSMSAEERLEVSRRMSAYWAARRARGGTRKRNGNPESVGNGVSA